VEVEGGRVVTSIKGNRKWQLMFGLKVLFFVPNKIKALKLKGFRNGKFYSLFRWEKNVV